MTSKRNKSGTLFIISAPSGAGKTTLVHGLLDSFPNLFVSISHTTRDKRPYEKDGIDYHFVDETTFISMVESDKFLEYAKVFDNYYGTSKQLVEEQLLAGRDIILEIEWQGARQVRQLVPNVVSIFVFPPSYETLISRLSDRGEGEEAIERRMRDAKNELSHYGEYDYLVVNDNIETALEQLRGIITTSQHSYIQQKPFFDDFVTELLVKS